MSQGQLIVVTDLEFTYRLLRDMSMDILKMLMERSQGDFDDYVIMSNLLSRGTTCMGSMLLLEKASAEHDAGILGRHLVELLAMTSYVFVGGRTRGFRGYSYSLMEKRFSRIRQIRRELDSVTEEHLNRQGPIHNDLRKQVRTLSDDDREWQPPGMESLFTSPEFAKVMGKARLDRNLYDTMHRAASTLFVHVTAYTGGTDREFLLSGNTRPNGNLVHYMLAYHLLVLLAMELIGDKVVGEEFVKRFLHIRERLLSD